MTTHKIGKFFILSLMLITLEFPLKSAGFQLTDPSGDISITGLDIVAAEIIGNDIAITMDTTPELISQSVVFVLLSSNADHTDWDAGIAVIGSIFPSVYWNTGYLCSTPWNLDSSKYLIEGNQIRLNFIEYEDLPIAEFAILSIRASSFDWAPNQAVSYADFSVFYPIASSVNIPSSSSSCFGNQPPTQTSTSSNGNTQSSSTQTIPSSSSSGSSQSIPRSTTRQSENNSGNPLPIKLEFYSIFVGLIAITIYVRFKYKHKR